MNELRLEYKRETGVNVQRDIHFDEPADITYGWDGDKQIHELDLSAWYEIKEYIEWLEGKLL